MMSEPAGHPTSQPQPPPPTANTCRSHQPTNPPQPKNKYLKNRLQNSPLSYRFFQVLGFGEWCLGVGFSVFFSFFSFFLVRGIFYRFPECTKFVSCAYYVGGSFYMIFVCII